MKKLSLLILLISISFMSAFSQGVGINGTGNAADASAMLDVSSTNTGVLIPRLALTQTTSASPVTSPVTSLLVYNTATVNDVTPGYYYWNGSAWVRFISGSTANLTFNNSGSGSASGTVYNGTTPYTISYNTIGAVGGSGTTDYLARWTSSTTLGNGVTRDNNSTVGINAAPNASYRLYVDGASAMTAIYGQYDANNYGYIGNSSQGGYFHGGVASSSESYVKLAVSNWEGVYAYAYNDDAIEGHTASSNYQAVRGINDNASGGYGVYGQGVGGGVYGYGSGSGWGVYGSASGNSGVWGQTSSTNQFHYGVYGFTSNVNGTGIAGNGNNTSNYSVPTYGCGGVFNGYQNSTNDAIGVYGRAVNESTGRSGGGFFIGNRQGVESYAWVGFYSETGTQYKITGVGTVSTIVKDNNNELVTLHCPETPEVYFQDFGEAQLVNGKVHIDLDPTFAKNIAVNEKHPLHVMIQLYDDENCKGVIVKNRTKNGFDVVELNNGTSNAKLSWFVTANRADDINEKGEVVSKYQDLRFEKGAAPAPSSSTKTDSNLPKMEEPEKK